MTSQNFEAMRQSMVASQLRTNAVNDARVLDAVGKVAREKFVPSDRMNLAYIDIAVPLGDGRALNPTVVTARLLSEARPQPHERALVIGAATGYSAALLKELVASVVAVEESAELVSHARRALVGADVEFVEGPLKQGAPGTGPYDLILIDGAVEEIPPAIIAQLAETGRLAAAILDRGVARLGLGRRGGDGFGFSAYTDADTVMLPGFEKQKEFSF